MSPAGEVAPASGGTMPPGATSGGQSTGQATSSALHLAGAKRDESATAKHAITVGAIPTRTKALVVILLTLVLVGGVVVLATSMSNTRSVPTDPTVIVAPVQNPPPVRTDPLEPNCGGYDSVVGKTRSATVARSASRSG
jgi:hypothetical protein